MADLLSSCRERLLSGQQDPSQPGQNSIRPLHVIVQVTNASHSQFKFPKPELDVKAVIELDLVMVQGNGGNLARQQRAGNVLLGLLRGIASFFFTTAVTCLLLIVGFETVRKYSPATLGGAPTAAATTVSSSSQPTAFAPKEYNRVSTFVADRNRNKWIPLVHLENSMHAEPGCQS